MVIIVPKMQPHDRACTCGWCSSHDGWEHDFRTVKVARRFLWFRWTTVVRRCVHCECPEGIVALGTRCVKEPAGAS